MSRVHMWARDYTRLALSLHTLQESEIAFLIGYVNRATGNFR